MTDEILDADELAAALDGALQGDAGTRALTSMAHELSNALGSFSLDDADRARIWSHSMRLIDGAGIDLPTRRVWTRVHMSRRNGAVLGGVAAASIAAAIGYAVVHDRRQRGGRAAA